jgi:hypothetical protein
LFMTALMMMDGGPTRIRRMCRRIRPSRWLPIPLFMTAFMMMDGGPKEVPPDPAVTVAPAMPEETQTGTEPLAASLAGIERSDQRLLPDPAPIPREPDLRFKLELAVRATGEATATVTVAVPAAVLGCFGNASRQPITL